MNTLIEITNQQLFDAKIDEVETSSLSGNDEGTEFYGNVTLKWAEGGSQLYTGEFGLNDFQEDYGFIFVVD